MRLDGLSDFFNEKMLGDDEEKKDEYFITAEVLGFTTNAK